MSSHEVGAAVAGVLAGDRAWVGRALTAVENDVDGNTELLDRLLAATSAPARVLGVTGPPGAGKSTFVASLSRHWQHAFGRTALLLVDPSSPVTGGAVLGDRVRMRPATADPTFVRSVANRGHLGGLSRSTSAAVAVLGAAGFGRVIVETVGSGQSDIEITRIAHLTALVVPPGLGDEIQAIKAGILEVADVIVISKADLPTASATATELAMAVHSSTRPGRAVIETSARSGQGMDDAARSIHEALAGASSSPAMLFESMLTAAVAEVVATWETGPGHHHIAGCARGVAGGSQSLDGARRSALDHLRRHLEQAAP